MTQGTYFETATNSELKKNIEKKLTIRSKDVVASLDYNSQSPQEIFAQSPIIHTKKIAKLEEKTLKSRAYIALSSCVVELTEEARRSFAIFG